MAATKLQNHIEFIPNKEGRTLMYINWQYGADDENPCLVLCELHFDGELEVLSAVDDNREAVHQHFGDNNIDRLESFVKDALVESLCEDMD